MITSPKRSFTTIAFFACILFLEACNGNGTNHPVSKDSLTTLAAQQKDGIVISASDTTVTDPKLTFINPDTAGKRTIYLTFDDGPNNATQNVINIIKQEQVPATFFIVGLHVRVMNASRKVMPQLRKMPNVVICNHSYTHAFEGHYETFYREIGKCVNDFERCRDSVHFNNNITRTPGNNIWRTPKFNQTTYPRYKPVMDSIHNAGFTLFGWDVEWRFKGLALRQTEPQMKKEIDAMFTNHDNRMPNHCVLLMHDIIFMDSKDSTSLVQLLRDIKADPRYRFDLATNHPYIKNTQ
jgi:peptidoglycan/xylan/chitin deacetylase (PgdA/CDA1 family)